MIKKILIGFLAAVAAVLVLLWLVTGGPRKVGETAGAITSSFKQLFGNGTSTGQFRLPWQPEGLMLGPDFAAELDASSEEGLTPEERLRRAEEEYEQVLDEAEEAKTFGDPSPHRGSVFISEGAAAEGPASKEYVEIEASGNNTAPVSLAGWSLQSALTGLRSFIPRAAEKFVLGAVNEQRDVYLNPGATAIIASGSSPVGTSFRENMCTAYLNGLQSFTPTLARNNCPPSSDSLPLTPENLGTYGDACYDFVRTLPPCTFPRELPGNLSPACHLFLANNLSYNGCIKNYGYKTDFLRDAWRIHLNAGGELWRNTHDIIRLLDAEGRTVDVVSY